MNELELKIPNMEDKEIIEEFKKEFIEHNELNKMFGSGSLDKFETFEEWLEKIRIHSSAETCPADRVPATQFISIRKKDGKMIGMVNIRHSLTEFLLQHGGHIGDCVRPTERQKGYGSMQIALAIEECAKLNIERALITCNASNIGSARTIQKNGGVLENEIVEENGNVLQRYWIDVKERKSSYENIL